jgi:iron complex transport system ATP-binding protein
VIAFDDVVVRYPRASRDALAGVSFTVQRGAITAVVGPNGSGKSTLVRAVLGRVAVSGGRVLIDGEDVARLSRDAVARRVAIVAPREELAFPLGVMEYVALGRFPHLGMWHAAGARDEEVIDAAARSAGIDALRDRRVDALSGGEWQRVRLARALAQQGDAIVLDEPTAFLDVGHEMAAFELLHRLAGAGQAVLLVSHQLNLVARFANQLVLLNEGRIAAVGTPAEVMRPEILEPVYQWPLVVTHDPAVGAPTLVPLRESR